MTGTQSSFKLKVTMSKGRGSRTRFRPRGDETLEIDAVVKTVVLGREIRQLGGIPGLLTFDHQWLLEPDGDGTRVIQHEVDRGLLLWLWYSSWIVPSYTGASEALRDRVMASANRLSA